jgi:Sec-independent protein translocase protein TatA
MKATKALKRLTHVEDLLSDVMERYSAGASDIRENLQSAKAAVGRAKDAVKSQEASEKTSAQKTDASKKAVVKVRRTKAAKKHSKTGRNDGE